MPTDPAPVTLAQVVHRAVETCDDGTSAALDELLERFEDADEPVAGVEDIERRLDESVGPREEDGDPAFTMACAVIVYLAHRRDEVRADPAELLRLAARAEFDGHPPAELAAWLRERDVHV
ncbi:MAG: hypothetical protein M3Z27_08600 [Actinomycetota bacterium]|nr:hypothetical protein [Actinomycetota bacterium]